jgi:hypothetical protein
MDLARRHLPAAARGLATSVAVVLATVLLPAPAAPAATGVTVPRQFFGQHDSRPESWPRVTVGSVRLWDAGVTWRDIERTPGSYDWSRLDTLVRVARAKGAEITLTLGQTPTFRVAQPSTQRPGCGEAPTDPHCARYGAGATSMPNTNAWIAYVKEVAARYRGRIAALQVWNEANVPGFWSGTQAQMAELSYLAKRAVGSNMQIVSPSFVGRTNRSLISGYFAAKPHGQPVRNFFDKVGLSLYPAPTGTPETSTEDTFGPLKVVQRILKKYKVNKPIWNTEINYGLASGGTGAKPPTISADRQAAYVVRTYLLNADARIQRVFWYAWDLQSIGNTYLSTSSGSPTLAGRAVGLTASWVAKSRLKSCSRATRGATKGLFVCTLTYRGGVKRIYWNTHPTKRVKVTMPKTATYGISLYGKKTKIKGGSKKYVDYRPLLVRSKK